MSLIIKLIEITWISWSWGLKEVEYCEYIKDVYSSILWVYQRRPFNIFNLHLDKQSVTKATANIFASSREWELYIFPPVYYPNYREWRSNMHMIHQTVQFLSLWEESMVGDKRLNLLVDVWRTTSRDLNRVAHMCWASRV